MRGQTMAGMDNALTLHALHCLDGRLIAVLFRLSVHGSARLRQAGIGLFGRAEHVRPQLVPADAGELLDGEAVMRRHQARALPAGDVLRLEAASLGQAARTTVAEGFDEVFDSVHGAIKRAAYAACQPPVYWPAPPARPSSTND